MPKYEGWKDTESITFACPETIQAQKVAGLIAWNAKKLCVIEAETFDEAMVKFHEFMEWEPYKPPKEKEAEVGMILPMRTLYGAGF